MSEREESQEDVSECGAVRERESAWESERVCVNGSELRTGSQGGERVSPLPPPLAAEQLDLRRESGMNRVSLWTSAYHRKGEGVGGKSEQAKVKEDREESHRCQNYQYQNR
jgi:hypothetical protein